MDEDEAPLDPAAERLRRKLVRLLLVSGGIMALGLIAVFSAIVYKLSEGGAARSGSPVAGQIAVPAGARLVSAELDGDRLLVRVEAPDANTSLIVLDIRSGEVVGRFAFRPE